MSHTMYIYLPVVIIDSHCHFRGLKQSYKTTPAIVIIEAAESGIIVICYEPNTDEPLNTWERVKDYYLKEVLITPAYNPYNPNRRQFGFFGASDNNHNEARRCLAYPFIVGSKGYSKGVTTGADSLFLESESAIITHMEIDRYYNKAFEYHCDDSRIVALEGYTIRAEMERVDLILSLARKVPGVKIIFPHLSCIGSIELVLKARKDYKINAALEIMPHYLWFDSEGYNWNPELEAVFYHCFNNLRGSEHREYLCQLIAKGHPFVWNASDSACHTKEEKLASAVYDKNGKLIEGLGGIPSHRHLLPVICTKAKEMNIPDWQVANLTCFNQARFLNIQVPYQLVKYKLEERIDDQLYNNGIVENPWKGSRLLFPVSVK